LGIHLSRQLGQEYMPPLDEGSILDMPVTVPRASVTQVANDLKIRDAILRRFPEVEQVVGKAGRAETPTDPAPLDMVETVVNLIPRERWPKRKLNYDDAQRQTQVALAALVAKGLVTIPTDADADTIVDPATMSALSRFDATMRVFLVERRAEFHAELSRAVTDDFLAELLRHWRRSGRLTREPNADEAASISGTLSAQFGSILADGPAQEDINR
jgi:Cu(I)/Ag(I) efflux system membrane protein CusA/SilA